MPKGPGDIIGIDICIDGVGGAAAGVWADTEPAPTKDTRVNKIQSQPFRIAALG